MPVGLNGGPVDEAFIEGATEPNATLVAPVLLEATLTDAIFLFVGPTLAPCRERGSFLGPRGTAQALALLFDLQDLVLEFAVSAEDRDGLPRP